MNAALDMKDAYIQPKAILLAVSRERGLDHIEVFNNSIDGRKFKSFLDNLRSKYLYDDGQLIAPQVK